MKQYSTGNPRPPRMVVGITDTQQENYTTTVMRPYTTLPKGQQSTEPREPYIDRLPDALAGLLRQFATQMLDLGRLGIDDPARYKVYRGKVFDVRDELLGKLGDWLVFTGLTDGNCSPAATTLDDDVFQFLAEKVRAVQHEG